MSREEAAHHIDLCVQSGLLIPEKKNAEGDGAGETKSNKEKITEVMGKSQAEQ